MPLIVGRTSRRPSPVTSKACTCALATLGTTKDLLDIGTRHTSGEEAVGAAFTMGNAKAADEGGRAAPSKVTVKGARKGGKGGKKWLKQCPQCVAITASDDSDNEKVDDSSEEYAVAVE
jgi:hypothetical protein